MCRACGVAVGGAKAAQIGRLEAYRHHTAVAGCHDILQMVKLTKATLQAECAKRGVTKSGNHIAILLRILAADQSAVAAGTAAAAGTGTARKRKADTGAASASARKKKTSAPAATSPAASPASSPPAPRALHFDGCRCGCVEQLPRFTDRPNQTKAYHRRLMAA
jgi:hypothetical protein